MTLKEVIRLWLPEKKKQIKISTFSAYSYICIRTLIPALGEKDISEIDKAAARSFADNQLESKSPKTVKDYLIVLKMLVKFAAEELGQTIQSTEWKIPWPSANLGSHKVERYSPRQMKAILEYLMANPSNAALGVLIALTTGCRIGEVCALRFSDVDFDKGIIHITKTVERIGFYTEMERDSNGKTKVIEGPPKTRNSLRDVPLTPKVKKMLRAYSAVARPDYYIATGDTHCCEPSIFRKYAARMVEAAGVSPVLKFHALRHTFATTLIEKDVDAKTVSSILGHANVAVTLNLYVHPSDEVKASAVNKGLKGIL